MHRGAWLQGGDSMGDKIYVISKRGRGGTGTGGKTKRSSRSAPTAREAGIRGKEKGEGPSVRQKGKQPFQDKIAENQGPAG